MAEKTIPQKIRALMERAGLVQLTLAQGMGFKGASSVQRYLSDNDFTDEFLSPKVAAKLEKALVGKGSPPITRDEVWELSGMLGSNGIATEEKARPTPNASFPPKWQQFPGDVSIPLRGKISAGPNGRFIMNGQDIARVFCPPGLEGVEGAYAVQIEGTSGEPRFYSGETAWVNPAARYRQGDDVIVQVMGDNGDDDVYSYIKRFVSESNGVLRLYQYNPGPGEAHELEFIRSKVFSIQKVVFHAML